MIHDIFDAKVGFDLDGILVDFKQGLIDEAMYHPDVMWDFPTVPEDWVEHKPPGFDDLFPRVKNCAAFWLGLPPKKDGLLMRDNMHSTVLWGGFIYGWRSSLIPIHGYITARSIDSSVSRKWLEKHGFPTTIGWNEIPVVTVQDEPKSKYVDELGLDYFVEDNYDNWKEINENSNAKSFLIRTINNDRHITSRDAETGLVFDSLVQWHRFHTQGKMTMTYSYPIST